MRQTRKNRADQRNKLIADIERWYPILNDGAKMPDGFVNQTTLDSAIQGLHDAMWTQLQVEAQREINAQLKALCEASKGGDSFENRQIQTLAALSAHQAEIAAKRRTSKPPVTLPEPKNPDVRDTRLPRPFFRANRPT